MKKKVFGRKFKRDANERKALFKNLLTSLVLKERIKTTEPKAKAIKGAADKLITKVKKKGEKAYQDLHPQVNGDAVEKLIKDLGQRFGKRDGGYTRIIKIGKKRIGDNAEMVYLEWTERSEKLEVIGEKAKKAKKKASKKPATTETQKKSETQKKDKSQEFSASEDLSASAVARKILENKKKEKDKPKSGGFLKQLVTRQKKG